MRAIGVNQFGGPEQLRVVDVPEPHAGPGEVRIRVHAATVNPTDTGPRSGAYGDRIGNHKPPYIPGADAAGVIVPRGDDFGQRIRTIAPVGVDALADGAVLDAAVLPAIRDGG